MCILKGFPTLTAKSKTGVSYPFGIWFANPDTIYLADEGSGDNTYSTHDRDLHQRPARQQPDRRPAEVGLRHDDRPVEPRVHADVRPEPGPAVHGPRLSHRRQPGDRGCRGRRRPTACATSRAESTRTGPPRSGPRRSTVSGGGDQGADPNKLVHDHRQARRYDAADDRIVHSDRLSCVRASVPRRVVHPRDRHRRVLAVRQGASKTSAT